MITAVALSGGLDSLAAAFFLKQQGHRVTGIHFITGYEAALPRYDHTDIMATASQAMAPIADQLDIPLHVLDCRRTFESTIVDYFTETYTQGQTPNPCMVCNKRIKFGWLVEAAKNLGACRVATGHYARCDAAGSRLRLRKGIDSQKDQSYFLAMLSQGQLAHACFPLGGFTKEEIRRIADDKGLKPVSVTESQDICFIRNQSYRSFLERRFENAPCSGPIVDSGGTILGRHQGLHRYTVGQRRGIDCPASAPYYVLRLDVKNNRLVVGFKEELYASRCCITDVNWITPIPAGPVRVQTRLRYRHKAAEGTIKPITTEKAIICFDNPQPAVTPGQAAVCYNGDEVLAAGWIVDR